MNRVHKAIAVWAVTVVAAVSVYSQEVTKEDAKSQTTQTVVADQQQATTTQNYVFPTHRERFNRYVKGTVGPFRLAWTAASAGIHQWDDHPEEWGQGMKGYGKRYASSFGQNAIQQTVTYGFDEAFGLDGTDDETGRVVFAFGVQAGHLCGFTADQCHSIVRACARHAANQFHQHVRFEPAHRDVVQKKQWTGAAGQNVVYAVIDEVCTDSCVRLTTEDERQFDLRSDPIGAGDQEPLIARA